jgi:hypothetical protein
VPSALAWQMLNHRQANADDRHHGQANALANGTTANANVPAGHISFVYTLMHGSVMVSASSRLDAETVRC